VRQVDRYCHRSVDSSKLFGTARLKCAGKNITNLRFYLNIRCLFVVAGLAIPPLLLLAAGNYLVVAIPLDSPDAIVVLSGAADYEERNLEAARLFRNGSGRRIVLTDDGVPGGWSNENERNLQFVEKASALLVENGVPEQAIEIVPGAINDGKAIGTVVEARKILAFCRERRYSRLLLVTSAYHSRRALATFNVESREQGLETEIGIAHPPTQYGRIPHPSWIIMPGQWARAAGEYAKMFLGEGPQS